MHKEETNLLQNIDKLRTLSVSEREALPYFIGWEDATEGTGPYIASLSLITAVIYYTRNDINHN